LFIPRRPLIASMLASDLDNSWFRIAKASMIMAARPALTSASAPFSMTAALVAVSAFLQGVIGPSNSSIVLGRSSGFVVVPNKDRATIGSQIGLCMKHLKVAARSWKRGSNCPCSTTSLNRPNPRGNSRQPLALWQVSGISPAQSLHSISPEAIMSGFHQGDSATRPPPKGRLHGYPVGAKLLKKMCIARGMRHSALQRRQIKRKMKTAVR
jgi:hypothetical protein